jgi:bifunctional non-homologous end joining protein LigD
MKAATPATLHVDGHEVKITRPEKVLFPEDGLTKDDLIRYYQRIAPRMLPYLEGRPLSMQRFPNGIHQPGFFQKAAPRYYPDWIRKVTVQKAGGAVRHAICDNAATLVYLANQACITPHPWLSRADRPHIPDQMIFDLDPSGAELDPVIEAAHALYDLLGDLELPAYVKATGSRGLHVVIPLERREDFDPVRDFARQVAEIVAARDPARYTLEQYKKKRGDRVYLDIHRNAYAQTAAPVYAVRARPGAPVAAPLEWADLRAEGFRPDGLTMQTIFERMERTPDPWKDFWRNAAPLDKARRKLQRLHAVA